MSDAKHLLNEILDYFQAEDRDPGGDWAFPDDFSSLGLDYRDRFDTKLWLDLERDGTIHLVWKFRNGEMKRMIFAQRRS